MENKTIVERMRNRFAEEYKTNGDLYDKTDANKVVSNDWEIERFVMEFSAEDKAYDSMIRALRWRHSFGVHRRSDQYFPKEFYQLGDKECFGRDREGRLIQWECYRNDRRKVSASLMTLQKQFMAHIVHRLDGRVAADGYTLVSDIRGAGLLNANYELMRFRIQLMAYYPQLLRRIIVVDLPSVLNAFTRLMLTFVSNHIKKRVKFIGRHELRDFMPEDVIPVRLDGPRQEWAFPEDLLSMNALKHLDLTPDEINKYLDMYFDKLSQN